VCRGAVALAGCLAAAAAFAAPSLEKGCTWSTFEDAKLGLGARVQVCDLGFRKIGWVVEKSALAERDSDAAAPEPIVDVLDLQPGETVEAGIARIAKAHAPAAEAARCVVRPYETGKSPAGVARYAFVPDARYEKELAAKNDPDQVPDPPCGDWGDAPDGIQYFEAHPKSPVRRVLFVRIGQDEPLFDPDTLELLPPKTGAH
jgi:hypothetical protein